MVKKNTISKFVDIAFNKMKDTVIKLLDPSELFDKEQILSDFNIDHIGREALRENLNAYKREFILENIKFFCLAICPGIPASARAFGAQMLEFKKSLEEDINFKRVEVEIKRDIEALADKLDEKTNSIEAEINLLRSSIKPEFLVDPPPRRDIKPKILWKETINKVRLKNNAVAKLKRTRSQEETEALKAKNEEDFTKAIKNKEDDDFFDLEFEDDTIPEDTESTVPDSTVPTQSVEAAPVVYEGKIPSDVASKLKRDRFGQKGSLKKKKHKRLRTKNKKSNDDKYKKSKKDDKSSKSEKSKHKKPRTSKKPNRTRRK